MMWPGVAGIEEYSVVDIVYHNLVGIVHYDVVDIAYHGTVGMVYHVDAGNVDNYDLQIGCHGAALAFWDIQLVDVRFCHIPNT